MKLPQSIYSVWQKPSETIETWYTHSSKGDKLSDIIELCFHDKHSIPVLPVVWNILVNFSPEKFDFDK